MTCKHRCLCPILIIAITALLRPAKALYPRLWQQWFGSALCHAAYLGSARLVQFLLWLHPDVEAREPILQSCAIISAAGQGNMELVKYLISRGAGVNARDESGRTALMSSAYRGHADVSKLLLDSGADVNVRKTHGETAFIEAAKSGNTALMQLLIENGADRYAAGPFIMDALVWSASLGYAECVEFLLERGVTADTKRGQAALMLAQHNGHAHIVARLRQSGAVA